MEGGPILAALPVPVVAADDTGRIVYGNPAAERLLGWPPGGLVGQPLVMLVPERFQHAHRAGFRRYLRTSQPRLIGHPRVLPARRADGTEVDVELALGVVAAGRQLFVASLRPPTVGDGPADPQADGRLLEAVTEVAVRVSLTAEAGGVAGAVRVVLEALGGRLGWDAGAAWTAPGIAGEPVCVATWRAMGEAPVDGERQPAAAELARRVWREAEPVWVADLGEDAALRAALAFPILSGDRVLAVVGLFGRSARPPDVALVDAVAALGPQLGALVERHRAEEADRFRAALLASEAEATLDGVLALSPRGEVLFWNSRLLEMAGVGDAVLRRGRGGELLEAVLPRLADPAGFRAVVDRALGHPLEAVRTEVHLADGRTLDCHSSPLRGEDGVLYGRAWHFRDITEHKESARRFAALAETLQATLLPPLPPDIPGIEVATRYRPARASAAAGMEVGGDFYDLFPTRGTSWGFAIGDVCGKGVEAATLTALARYTIRAAAMRVRRPSQVLTVLNDAVLRDEAQTRFLTVATGFLRARPTGVEVVFATGGHPLPLVVRSDGRVEPAGQPGLLIGAFRRPELHDTRVRLGPGDAVVLYTDGVTEARGPTGMLDDEGLQAVLAVGPGTAEQLADRVVDAVVAVSRGEPRDDVAVVVIRVPASGEEPAAEAPGA